MRASHKSPTHVLLSPGSVGWDVNTSLRKMTDSKGWTKILLYTVQRGSCGIKASVV